MDYLLCFLLPPLAVLLRGRPVSALLNILLSLLYLPGVIHALVITHNHHADRRHREMMAALTGKPVPPAPQSGEWSLMLALVTAGTLVVVARSSQLKHLPPNSRIKPVTSARLSAHLVRLEWAASPLASKSNATGLCLTS